MIEWNNLGNEYGEYLEHSTKQGKGKELNTGFGNVEMDSDIDKSHLSGVNTDGLIEVSSKENRLVALFFFLEQFINI